MNRTRIGLAAALLAMAQGGAQAGEVYAGVGFPGVMLGFAQPLDTRFTVRADVATLGTRDDSFTEEGIRYRGKSRIARTGLFADWFPFGGSFRTSVGMTFNDHKLDLSATGSGGTLTIGDTTYVTTADDRFDVRVKFPSTTPYLGVGWGHQQAERGLRFAADLGVSIGRAKVSTRVSGALAGQVSQQDIDRETAELREGVGHVRVMPQATVAIGYSF